MNHEPSTDDEAIGAEVRIQPTVSGSTWRFRLAALCLGLLPFLLVEAGFRLFVGRPAVREAIDNDPLVDLHQLQPLFVLNKAADRWEIPQHRYNFFRPDSFSESKAKDVRRVFVLGGSTVQGRPFEIETAFSTWLRLRLQAADAGHQYEVINCGGVSYASYRVAKILQEVITHQPDAIVLYTGHNEFLEDRTYAEVREMGAARQWANRLGSYSQTVQWLRSLRTESVAKRTELASEVNARLDHQGGMESYRRDPVWRRGVERHFAEKLQQMVDVCQQSGVPLIVCTPASDLISTPPFKVQSVSTLSEVQRTRFDVAWAVAGDSKRIAVDRIRAAKTCLSIDTNHAGANYVLGRLLLEHGQAAQARRYLLAARDHDVCPLRATTAIVDSVRRLVAKNGVRVVDTISLLDQRSVQGERLPDQIPDPERFVDHLHPSVVGHQMIAAAIAGEFHQLGWGQSSQEAEEAYQEAARQHLTGLGEDYFARGKQRLEGLKRWASGAVVSPDKQ